MLSNCFGGTQRCHVLRVGSTCLSLGGGGNTVVLDRTKSDLSFGSTVWVVLVLRVSIELAFQLSNTCTQQPVLVLDVLTQFIVRGFVADQDGVTQGIQRFHEVFETVKVADVV
ncbi:hypothetical protein D3C85_1475550 [compost metagenome]